MAFRTKLDFSSNRQVKQHIETITVLSGGTSFGVPFNLLPTGPDLTTSGDTGFISNIVSTFSGNNTTTIYNWYDPNMQLGWSSLSAITPSTSGITQEIVDPIFTANTSTVIDGNTITLDYSGVSFDVYVLAMTDLGGGNYSGTVETDDLYFYSAGTLDFTGRTIWADVSGITRTQELIITKNPGIAHVLTCLDAEGKAGWLPLTAATSASTVWDISTNPNSAILNGSTSIASGLFSVAEGYFTLASGITSHAEGESTIAGGQNSHAEGLNTIAYGYGSHAEGLGTTANSTGSHAEGQATFAGFSAHAEGAGTIASGSFSHAEGQGSAAFGQSSHAENGSVAYGLNSHSQGIAVAYGDYSHASGGVGAHASGTTSFVHGTNSKAIGNNTIVLGGSITGTTANMTYVDTLNIKTVGVGPGTSIAIDGTGQVVLTASDLRLKENISTLTNSLDKVKNLRGVTFQLKDRVAGGDNFRIGFIAQEVNEIVPELTFINKTIPEEYMGVHYSDVTALLVEAVKELATGTTSSNTTYLETQTILAEDNNIELNYSGTPTTAIGGGISVLHAKGVGLSAEIITDAEGNWVTNNDFKPNALTIPIYTPTSTSDINGSEGNLTRDDDYLYVRTSTGWKRTNLENF